MACSYGVSQKVTRGESDFSVQWLARNRRGVPRRCAPWWKNTRQQRRSIDLRLGLVVRTTENETHSLQFRIHRYFRGF
jgi:hypothetical protein